jgi:hypothetical protein
MQGIIVMLGQIVLIQQMALWVIAALKEDTAVSSV